MQHGLNKLQQLGKLSKDCQVLEIQQDTSWSSKWQELFGGADFVLIRWMGTGLDTPFLEKSVKFLQKAQKKFYVDPTGDPVNESTNGLTEEQILAIRNYLGYAGEVNFYNLWLYLKNLVNQGEDAVPAPKQLLWTGIFHPQAQEAYTSLAEYQKEHIKPGKPTIGLFFYRDEWIWGDLVYQTAIIEALEAKGMNVIAAFSNGMPVPEKGMPSLIEVFDAYFCEAGLPVVDVVINAMKFCWTSSPSMTLDYLEQFNIPVLQAYGVIAPYEEWKGSIEGLNAMEVSISVTMPEFDGIIHSVPVSNKKVYEDGTIRYLPIPERIERLVNKASKWAKLHYLENKEKKIAIIFHNYPPRNSNIGSAVGLDTIESIRRLLELMQARGYKVDFIPSTTKEFIRMLTENATNDKSMLNERQIREANKLDKRDYQRLFDGFDKSMRELLTKDWGKAPGEVMEFDGKLLIPGTMDGNVFITVQPARGFGEDPEKLYHDPFTAATHHYLGFYHWIRDVWKADAVAHIGTHGNLEWLPGKNAGLDSACYPDAALGDLVNIYPYHMTIIGEGIQAKRRGAACIIEHLPAPQSRAGVYDELEELEKLLDEYAHFKLVQPENLASLEELIKEKVVEANLQDEVVFDEAAPFVEYVGNLHNYISDLKNMECHIGLHILGQPPENELLTEELLLLTRLENDNCPSLNQAVAHAYGFDYYELLENSSLIYEPLGITYGMLIDKIAEQCREVVLVLQNSEFSKESIKEALELDWIKSGSIELKQLIEKVCSYICQVMYPNLQLTTREMVNFLRGFDGEYIKACQGGSPTSGGADLLPTGGNFFGVDVRTLPTPAAWEIGKILGDQVIERFILEEGHYPESVGMVFWSGSNMRSHGQCIAEYLYLMGLKPVYQSGSMKVKGLEVIPLTELKRPRIDVTARIGGLFRDTMPCVTELLDKAATMAASLDEDLDLNYVRKHVVEDSKELEEQGIASEEAWRQASFRVFGDQLGTYGAGISHLLEEKNWETLDDLARVYIRWGGHAYGAGAQGTYMPQMFRKRLGSLDITIKNEDNHDTNMFSSDDYNAYHGGMIACVRAIKGRAPRSYCGDSTDRSKVVMHSVQEEAKRIFRSESINPKFIEGMMKHGYKGAADMANMIAHSYQWDATSAVMEDWMYEKYAEKYVFDAKVQEWMKDVNPWALQRELEILLEAEQRGLWQAKAETKQQLQELYLSMEGELEEMSDD